jgi:hypothetical protein
MDFLNEETKRDERTEYITFHVTKEVKKDLELAKDNESLRDSIIKKFITSETSWLKEEMQGIDEATIKYRAKLLTIKDNFAESQDLYIEQIEDIYNNANNTFDKIGKRVDTVNKMIENATDKITSLNNRIKNVQLDYFNTSGLEKLLDVVERFNSMGEKEKDLINTLLKK